MGEFAVQLKPSWYLTIFCLVTHIAAGIVLFICPLSILLKTQGIMLMGISLGYALCWHALRIMPTAVSKVWVDADQQWFLKNKREDIQTVTLMGDSIVTTVLIILNFKKQKWSWFTGQRISVVLCPDMLDQESFRRLRVKLSSPPKRGFS